jgi:4a-hydroxytetrahydrobiopterin dehydratase
MSLSKKNCIPCEDKDLKPLSYAHAVQLHHEIPDWRLAETGHDISREFLFNDFIQALDFINRVGDLAESEGHHPDILNSYNKVQLILYTHSIDGLSENDFILASKIDMMISNESIAIL